MNVPLKLNVTRFSQTEPGDLFMFPHSDGLSIAMTVTDPANDGEKLVVILGPDFPRGMIGPSLMTPPGTTVMSFGKEYTISLPCEVEGWLMNVPSDDVSCLIFTDQGKIFIRANYRLPDRFRPCYIDMQNGEIHTDKFMREYIMPRGDRAFAVKWELMTTEKKPRTILSYSTP